MDIGAWVCFLLNHEENDNLCFYCAKSTCQSTYDAVPLYLPQQLYLKPIARLNVSLQLPPRITGKNISNWEIMEQLRLLVKPEEFTVLKVIKNSVEVVRFVAELEEKSHLEKVIGKINKKMIKLKEFPEMLRLKAAEAKLDFPTRHSWDSFFREAKNMNEMKSGERPDTIHISNLPIKWFVSHHFVDDEEVKPSEKIFYRVFEKFGTIRHVDIPVCDPYRRKMKIEVSGMQMLLAEEEHYFEGYVQFRDYVGFSKAMDALRGMKLLHKDNGVNYTVNIIVDFDKTKHLSDASIRRREIVRDRLVTQEISKEEKEQEKKKEQQSKINSERQKEINLKNEKERRRREREEKRKSKLLAQLKMKGSDEINDKIAKEEKKLLKIQRKLEAIRLVEELFKRLKTKHEKSASLYRDERDEDELTRMKHTSEKEVLEQKQKLHRVIEGRTVLKSVLGSRSRRLSDSSNSDSSTSARPKNHDRANEPSTSKTFVPNIPQGFPGNEWYGYPVAGGMYPYIHPGPAYPPPGHHPAAFLYSRGRPNPRRGGRLNLRSRGGYRGPRNSYPPEMQEAYQRYFRKFLHEHDNRNKRSHSFSPSRSRTKSRSRSRRRSRSRSRRRSYTRSYTRSRSRSRSKYRSRHRSRSRSRSSSKQRSRSRGTPQSKRRRSRSRDAAPSKRRSRSKGTPVSRRRSRSRGTPSVSNKRSKSKSVRRSKSVDSSKFISPKRFRDQRSKSWSMPKEGDDNKNRRTWSRSPPA